MSFGLKYSQKWIARKALVSACFLTFLAVPAHGETLQEALISAYNSNPRLMAERSRLREIDENYIQARAQGRMNSSLNGNLGLSLTRIPLSGALAEQNGSYGTFSREPASAQIQVIQPLYQGGRVKALKAQAQAGIMAARESLRNTEQALFLSVATAYSNVLRDEEAARIRRNNVRVLGRQQQAAQDRFDVGVGTRTDIAQARARLAAADIGLAQADAQLQISRAAFLRTVGHQPAQLSALPTFVLPSTLETAKTLSRENNPQIIAAMFNVQAAEAGIKAAKSASKPTVSLNGTLGATRGQLAEISRAESGTIGAQFSIPIFAGGLNKSRVRAANEARTRLMFEVRDTERAVDEAMAQIWAQLDAAKRSFQASKIQVEAAEFAFEGVKIEQEVGTRSALDVLNAEQEVLDAKLAQLNSKAAVAEAEFRLLRTIGVFDSGGIQLGIDNYDPQKNLDEIKNDGLQRAIGTYVPETLKKIID